MTPTKASYIFKNNLINNSSFECFSIVLDKVNMHQAFDLDQDLLDLAKEKGFPKPKDVYYKTIFTTNLKEVKAEADEANENNYNEIKK